MDNCWDLYDTVEHTIDSPFEGKFTINMYEFLKIIKATKNDVEEFFNSSTAVEINGLILELEDYCEGGNDSKHKQLREAYGHLGKPEARKIKNYLSGILKDAERYGYDRRSGRRKKGTK